MLLIRLAVAALSAAVAFGQATLPTKDRFHLFLLVGQSNMAGRGMVEREDKSPNPRVWMLNQQGDWVSAADPMHFDKPIAGVGLGRTFARIVADANPGISIGLIPCAVGGSPIDTWKPGVFYPPTKSYPWDDALRRGRLALQVGVLKGILWHQGESDSTDQLAPGYAGKLHDLISRFRQELNAPDVPFLAGQLGQFQGAPWDDARKLVDRAHQELPRKVSHTAFVSSAGLRDKGDHTHFDSASYREFGKRYAEAYLRLVAQTPGQSTVRH